MRLALGASRGRLIRLLLVESVTLATIGAALGLIFATWASRALVTQLSTSDPPITLDLSLDGRVLAFTTALAIATAIFFGLVPAWRATDTTAMNALKQASRSAADPSAHRTFNLLLIAQVAVSLLLVLAAGLLVRTAQQLARAPLGFDHERVLTVMITAPSVPAANRNVFYHRLVDAVAATPGVASAGGSLDAPLTRFSAGVPLSASGARALPPADTISQIIDITPGWLGTYGTPLRAGRDIDGRDVRGAQSVMLVNESFARRFFPGAALVGRTVTVALDVPPTGIVSLGAKTIVGIVGDAVYSSIREPVPPTIYVPLAQRETPLFLSVFFMAVRPATASPAQVTQSVTAALHAVKPDLRITLRPAADQVNALLAQDRLIAKLAAFGGAQALLLATIGLYGRIRRVAASHGNGNQARARRHTRHRDARDSRSSHRSGGLWRVGRFRDRAVGLIVHRALALWAAPRRSARLHSSSCRSNRRRPAGRLATSKARVADESCRDPADVASSNSLFRPPTKRSSSR